MSGPSWVRWVFALMFLATGVHCVVRLLAARSGGRPGPVAHGPCASADRRGDLAHLTMSAGMTVMFLPLPSPVSPVCWAALFGAQTLWLTGSVLRPAADGPGAVPGGRPPGCAAHAAGSAVMAGMFAALPPDGLTDTAAVHAGHLSATSPLLAVAGWVAVAYFLGQVLRWGTRMAVHPASPTAVRVRRTAVAPVVTDGPLRLVMGLGMSYMLLTML